MDGVSGWWMFEGRRESKGQGIGEERGGEQWGGERERPHCLPEEDSRHPLMVSCILELQPRQRDREVPLDQGLESPDWHSAKRREREKGRERVKGTEKGGGRRKSEAKEIMISISQRQELWPLRFSKKRHHIPFPLSELRN